ncbi:cilia- and flagella-associated protein 418 [Halichoeres trimaculatus]|uniref:cilia- and flagella-associated protein 418 n=1 Tax=Halichoeres trimaculatus TaxID=147232 RepID=UPI003D9F9D76
MEEDDDDLDELLDEIERKFCRNVSVTPSARGESNEAGNRGKDDNVERKHSASKPAQPISSISEDIDALLEELLDDDCSDSPQTKTEEFPKATHGGKKVPSLSGGRKCCPVFVGGSSVPNGVGTATSKRSCDQLRCLSCDFRVLMFDDCEWDPSCDYLFLRNNMPDRQKLRAKLRKRRSYRAYACQCSWFSTSEPTELRERAQLSWVCGKHRD